MLRTSALLLLLGASGIGCSKIIADVSGNASAGSASASNVLQTARAAPVAPPKDVPSFLTRFCDAVAAADKAYVVAHADTTFSSSMGPDPDAPRRGRTKNYGGVHHAGDTNFNPVCTRIRAQPAGELARRVREQNGTFYVRLRQDGMASDLVVARNGADFKLLREDEPGGKAAAPSGGGGGGW